MSELVKRLLPTWLFIVVDPAQVQGELGETLK